MAIQQACHVAIAAKSSVQSTSGTAYIQLANTEPALYPDLTFDVDPKQVHELSCRGSCAAVLCDTQRPLRADYHLAHSPHNTCAASTQLRLCTDAPLVSLQEVLPEQHGWGRYVLAAYKVIN